MTRAIISDRQASRSEVTAADVALRKAAQDAGIIRARIRDDGTIIVHSPDAGYRTIARFAAAAADIVGTYVHVISDDVPAAQIDAPEL
jgi:hypothetical protein